MSDEEVSSIQLELIIKMSDEEEDLIFRVYRLVGQRWHLIAGRVPGRKPEEIQRYWMMKHGSCNAAGAPLVLKSTGS